MNADHFSRAYFLALDSMLEVLENELGCEGVELPSRKTLAQRAQEGLKSIKRFGIELGPNTWELYQNYGLSFALYFATTESLEHVLLAPILFGVPICKLIQGAYAWIANPMRAFVQGCLADPEREPSGATRMDRLAERVIRGAYALRAQRRVQQVFTRAAIQDGPVHVSRDLVRKRWLEDREPGTALSEQVAGSRYWAELAARESPVVQGLDFQSRSPEEDFALILKSDFAREHRLERAEAIGRGILEMHELLGSQWGALYHAREKASGKGFRDWATLFKTKGAWGKLRKAIDQWQNTLTSAAARSTSEHVTHRWSEDMALVYDKILRGFAQAAEIQIRWAKQGFPTDSKRELLELNSLVNWVGKATQMLSRGKTLSSPECIKILEQK